MTPSPSIGFQGYKKHASGPPILAGPLACINLSARREHSSQNWLRQIPVQTILADASLLPEVYTSALNHPVAEYAEAINFNLHHVSRLQENGRLARETDAWRRAGKDQISRLQGEHLR
jgi:hypothetical protein